ncbi:MAG: hypothetical protein H0U74_11310, partial [Bradymonadaceae bacterium]|nr:hypothetical protein [Lujinxingiaceae bacterium]
MDFAWTRRGFSAIWILAVVVLVSAVFGMTFSLERDVASPDFSLGATWPASLSMTQPSMALGMISGESKAPWSSGTATLYALPHENRVYHHTAADVFLHGEGVVEIAQTTIDEHGVFELNIPGVREWPKSGAERTDKQSFPLILQVRIGKEYRYQWHTLSPAVDATAIALTLDRPLYQPGQKILMRAVVVDRTLGRPINAADVHWRMHDPQGNLVFDQRTPSSRSGVAAAGYELASQCLQGDYKISVEAGGASAEQIVSVLPFRLPRFAVSLSSEKPSVQPGELLSWRVEARYTHGEAVSAANVKTLVSWRTWDEEKSTTIEGKSDTQGQIAQSWTAPSELRPGSSVRLASVVTTDAGRAEQASHGISVAGSHPRVEIHPLGRGAFVVGKKNQAVAVVTDVRGLPLPEERLTIYAQEEAGQRTIDLVTDERGRVIFEWQPLAAGRLQARFPGHAMSMQNIDARVRQMSYHLRALTPVARVGEPYTVLVEPHEKARMLMLFAGESLVSAQPIAASAAPTRHSVTLTDSSRGLASLRVLKGSVVVDELVLWVRQKGSQNVLVAAEAKSYEPTDTAHVNLSFAVDDADHKSPVTFGLVGVDEALYALKERADVPFEILLRQSSASVAALLPMLDGLEEQDELGQQIAAAKFLAELEPDPRSFLSYLPSGSDISPPFARARAESALMKWSLALVLFVGLLLILIVALTWSPSRRSAYTIKNTTLALAVTLAAGLGGFVMAAVLENRFIIVVAIASLLVLVLLALATVRDRSVPALWWILSCAGAIAISVRILIVIDQSGADIDENVLLALLFIPLAVLGLSAINWVFVLLDRDERAAGLALAGWLGAVLIGLMGMMFGHTIEDKFSAANSRVVSDVVFGEISPAPPSPTMMEVTSEEIDWPQPEERAGGGGRGESRGMARRARSMEDSGILEKSDPFEPEAPAEVSKKGGVAQAPPQAGTVRSWFPETMVWMPEIESDAKGNARVSFHVPDSITTWRLDAWAHSYDGRFGQGQTGLRVARPVFMELDLPTHLTDGDRIDVPATL